MNIFSIPSLIRLMIYFSDSLFIGLKVMIPILFVLVVIKINFKKFDINGVIKTANMLLLLAATLFLLPMAVNIFTAWYSENEFEREMIITILTGPNWYQVVIPILTYGILPQLLWIKKLRSTIYSSFNIIILSFIGTLLVNYLSTTTHGLFEDIDWVEMGWKVGLFVVAFSTAFFIGWYGKAHRKRAG